MKNKSISKNNETGLISFVVDDELAGLRLDAAAAKVCPQISRSKITALAKSGQIMLNGRPAKPSAGLALGQTISFNAPEEQPEAPLPDAQVKFGVIYEDDELLVLNKPAGLVVHPGAGHTGPTLAAGLLAFCPALAQVGEAGRPGLVHRLDKDTSGLLAVAKNEEILELLAKKFSEREMTKTYLAFVYGRPKAFGGTIDAPIGRHPRQRHKMSLDSPVAKEAKTIYRLLRHFPDLGISLMHLRLITGRTHQIRVHLENLGTPLLGDPVYGRGSDKKALLRKEPRLADFLGRQMLHARRLSFEHPVDGRLRSFWAPWPDDFRALLKILMPPKV